MREEIVYNAKGMERAFSLNGDVLTWKDQGDEDAMKLDLIGMESVQLGQASDHASNTGTSCWVMKLIARETSVTITMDPTVNDDVECYKRLVSALHAKIDTVSPLTKYTECFDKNPLQTLIISGFFSLCPLTLGAFLALVGGVVVVPAITMLVVGGGVLMLIGGVLSFRCIKKYKPLRSYDPLNIPADLLP